MVMGVGQQRPGLLAREPDNSCAYSASFVPAQFIPAHPLYIRERLFWLPAPILPLASLPETSDSPPTSLL